MSRRRPKWGQIERYFRRRNYDIYQDGGDRIIAAPKDNDPTRLRQTVRIGHKFCARSGSQPLGAHLSKIRRAFGVTAEDIIND